MLKRINLVFIIAILLLIVVSMFYNGLIEDEEAISPNNSQSNMKTIIIDPGHGGIDGGAVNKYGENEAPLNLKISKYLRTFLETSGYKVIMTRYDEKALYDEMANTTIRQKKNEDLNNRIELINSSDADLVVSIHMNSFPQSQYYGSHAFYKAGSQDSKKAAELIQKAIKNIIDKENDRVPQKKTNVRVIDSSNKNFVLVECGFLSNEEESKKLCTDEYQEKIAWAIYAGILNYFILN